MKQGTALFNWRRLNDSSQVETDVSLTLRHHHEPILVVRERTMETLYLDRIYQLVENKDSLRFADGERGMVLQSAISEPEDLRENQENFLSTD